MRKATGAEGRRLRSAGSSRPAARRWPAWRRRERRAAGPGAVPACRSEAGEAVRLAARGAQGCVHSVMQAESRRRVRRCVNSVRHASGARGEEQLRSLFVLALSQQQTVHSVQQKLQILQKCAASRWKPAAWCNNYCNFFRCRN